MSTIFELIPRHHQLPTTITPNYYVPGYYARYDSPDLIAPRTFPYGPMVPGPPDRKARLFFACGPTRSGKSTFATRWMRREADVDGCPDDGFPRAVWCSDSLRLRLTGERYCRHAEAAVFMIKRYAIAALLERGMDVLVDGTHTTEESIKRLLEIDIDARYVLFDTPEDECVRRAHLTEQSDLVPVIERHCRQLARLKEQGLDVVMERLSGDIRARY